MRYQYVDLLLADAAQQDWNSSLLVAELVNHCRDQQEISDDALRWWRQLRGLVPEINKNAILQWVAENAEELKGKLG